MSLASRALEKFTRWALSKNAPGPYRGAPHDDRWAYTIYTDGDRYLTKVILFQTRWLTAYLHHFHRQDLDRAPHNHPWRRAVSVLLSGSYDEARTDRASWPDMLYRRVRFINFITDADYHLVERLHGDVWTLFFTGPRVQTWGFLVDGEHVDWDQYIKRAP